MGKLSGKPVGIDIIEIDRIERAMLSWHDSFLKRIYTDRELVNCYDRPSSLAVRFAAKEAVMKALGTGTTGVSWKDIEILSNGDGAPLIQLHGHAYEKAKESGITGFSVTLSHSKEYAIAFVIGDVV